MSAIKVLIVDDSSLIRQLLTQIFLQDPTLEVVGEAVDPFDAREKIKNLNPDVITLDVEMPRMDGITFLKNLMRLRPMPVIMISTLTEKGADITLQALELGAVDYIAKPKAAVVEELQKLGADIRAKVKLAARANVSALEHNIRQEQFLSPAQSRPDTSKSRYLLIAIGASTGGTEAIKEVLSALPENMPPIVIVQHMPEGFTGSFARRLNQLFKFTVEEFNSSAQILKPNHVYLAHGGIHMRVRASGGVIKGHSDDGPPVNRHKPAVDVLFDSVSELGDKAVGVILTGMGFDGAAGMGRMREAGALTIAQDEKSSVVWGMPRVAVQEGAASEVLPLSKIGHFLVDSCFGRAL